MVSGFERAKAEALAYLDARTTAKCTTRQEQEKEQDENCGNGKGKDERRGSFASL
jgi:hypothetical protein